VSRPLLFLPYIPSLLPLPTLPSPHRVHPPLRVSSSCVYSQCAVRIAMGPCANGHFNHVGSFGPAVLLLLAVVNLLLESVWLVGSQATWRTNTHLTLYFGIEHHSQPPSPWRSHLAKAAGQGALQGLWKHKAISGPWLCRPSEIGKDWHPHEEPLEHCSNRNMLDVKMSRFWIFSRKP
jgi:hypothetical protein